MEVADSCVQMPMMHAGCTKKEPIVVGKPAEFMLENIANAFGMERRQICMVGDRLDTDILFGQDGGLSTMLVLSGKFVKLPGVFVFIIHLSALYNCDRRQA